ncbi:hypothetical protein [Allonocardiopsis opalescens]|uniref:hypothetical protein n=1 Tax=Allonocardiopsis opalescens TaxID=1144618 RepID=UPI0011B214E3|nr:hypothetical protein [Allonocardiopsis opalescens]
MGTRALAAVGAVLGLVWLVAVLSGAGADALCGPGSQSCLERIRLFDWVSAAPALLAAVLTAAAAGTRPGPERAQVRRYALGYAVVAWTMALAVLFVGYAPIG